MEIILAVRSKAEGIRVEHMVRGNTPEVTTTVLLSIQPPPSLCKGAREINWWEPCRKRQMHDSHSISPDL